jgi:hypothetical protein
MLKEEVISSYDNMLNNVQPTVYPSAIWILLGVGALSVVFWIITRIIALKLSSEVTLGVTVMALWLVPFICVWFSLIIYNVENRAIALTDDEKKVKITSWKSDVFESKYLNGLDTLKLEVKDHGISGDTGLTFVVKTDKPDSVITGVTKVNYTSGTESYVEAKWVEGLSAAGISDGFYDVVAYLPDEEK